MGLINFEINSRRNSNLVSQKTVQNKQVMAEDKNVGFFFINISIYFIYLSAINSFYEKLVQSLYKCKVIINCDNHENNIIDNNY